MWANIILVIIYNKTLQESMTLKTLSEYKFYNTKVVIQNNGPSEVSYDCELFVRLNQCFDNQVELINSIDNVPLSVIYNDIFLKYKDSDRFILLDDDTEISESFVKAVKNSKVDLEVPKIISSGDRCVYYPICENEIVTTDRDLDPKSALSIGSGLIINNTLIEKFKRHDLKLFDEHYALYGVDFSLFRRIYKICTKGESVKIRSSSFLVHSLSRLDESSRKNNLRNIERALDVAITARRYPTFHLHYLLIRKFVAESMKMNWSNAYNIVKAYLLGCHPRCLKKY
ncbi:glycosyl transferase [Pectobacterium betavasculorum]|uniref:glycosyltransferase family 2 protein n=1 Tax=Pectobacterium betavasculorum TaxID=55207 RepID=UPI00313DA952